MLQGTPSRETNKVFFRNLQTVATLDGEHTDPAGFDNVALVIARGVVVKDADPTKDCYSSDCSATYQNVESFPRPQVIVGSLISSRVVRVLGGLTL